jgi:hypothetical protein
METSRVTLRTFPGEYRVVNRFPQGWYQVQRDDISGGAYYHVHEEYIERWLCGSADNVPLQGASTGLPSPPRLERDVDVPQERDNEEDTFEAGDEEDVGYENEPDEEYADEDDSGTPEEASEDCLATAERVLRVTRAGGPESQNSQVIPSTPRSEQNPFIQAAQEERTEEPGQMSALERISEEAALVTTRLRELDTATRETFAIDDPSLSASMGTFPGLDVSMFSVRGQWNGIKVRVLKIARTGKALCIYNVAGFDYAYIVLPLSEIRG